MATYETVFKDTVYVKNSIALCVGVAVVLYRDNGCWSGRVRLGRLLRAETMIVQRILGQTTENRKRAVIAGGRNFNGVLEE